MTYRRAYEVPNGHTPATTTHRAIAIALDRLSNLKATTACYGVCCELHGRCERYQLVEYLDTRNAIASCLTHDGLRPMYKEMPTTAWTHEMYLRFKQAYGDAVGARQPEFIFDGNEYATKYAMYLLSYLVSIGLSQTA